MRHTVCAVKHTECINRTLWGNTPMMGKGAELLESTSVPEHMTSLFWSFNIFLSVMLLISELHLAVKGDVFTVHRVQCSALTLASHSYSCTSPHDVSLPAFLHQNENDTRTQLIYMVILPHTTQRNSIALTRARLSPECKHVSAANPACLQFKEFSFISEL